MVEKLRHLSSFISLLKNRIGPNQLMTSKLFQQDVLLRKYLTVSHDRTHPLPLVTPVNFRSFPLSLTPQSSSRWYSTSQLSSLEQIANSTPGNVAAQSAFYSACLRANRPDVVVQRYQSGRFASSPAQNALYLRAVNALQRTDPNTSAFSTGTNSAFLNKPSRNYGYQNYAGQQLNPANAHSTLNWTSGRIKRENSGQSKPEPLYVVVEEPWRSTLFKLAKFLLTFGFTIWFTVVLLNLLLEGTGLLRRVSGTQHAEAKPDLQKTKFSDVQGAEEAKEELQEIVEFLKSPEKFTALGGKLPKGVLLVGPPGTGKTLLARAVAGEAGVPFFYMSGSEFDEVYVGVGAKRVRELFAAARAKAPAIVFIDELDAIGGKRNERDAAYVKQTLNQLLTDLDGFDQNSGVIFLAATNFPKLLDKALTRPGRFDRHVTVPLPDVRGRLAILQYHLKKVRADATVDPSVLARGTPGLSGAELENIVNQAAVHATRNKKPKVTMPDLEWAKDKVLMGVERKSAIIEDKDRLMTAYHEGGHALVALFTAAADPLYKATIMPRGQALGLTFQLPKMDRVSMAKKEYLARIDVCMGGKVAEELVYGSDSVTSGASSDLTTATAVAYAMVTKMGMSDAFGNIDLHSMYEQLSSDTRKQIWEEVRKILESSRTRATDILTSKRKELDLLADALVKHESLDKNEIERVVRGEKLADKLKFEIDKKVPVKLPTVLIDRFGNGDQPTNPYSPASCSAVPSDEMEGSDAVTG